MVPDVPVNWTTVEPRERGCRWTRQNGQITQLSFQEDRLTAAVPCDPRRRKRLCLSKLMAWRIGRPDTQSPRPTPLSRAEVENVVSAMVSFSNASGKPPILVLLDDDPSFAAWCALVTELFGDDSGPSAPTTTEVTTTLAWSVSVTAPFLERTPYGEELAQSVARALRKCSTGGLQHFHPYYCGHGLFFVDGEYRLAIVEDGLPMTNLATWRDDAEFVCAAAAWNDYVCSGADASHPFFATQSAWELANQRLTRARLEDFARNNA